MWGFSATAHHEAHAGEASASSAAFAALSTADKNAVIEFLKTLQVLKPGTTALVVDEDGEAREWPPSEDDDDGDGD